VPNKDLYVEGEKLERVESYAYLGTCQLFCGLYCSEIKIRIEKARVSFMRIKLFCSRNLSLDLKTRMLKCYVFLVLLYDVEAWTLNEYYGRIICYKRRGPKKNGEGRGVPT